MGILLGALTAILALGLVSAGLVLHRRLSARLDVIEARHRFASEQLGKITTYFELQAKIEKMRLRLDKPDQTLLDFLADLREHDCAVVRIDPGSILLRSPRG